MSDNVSIDPGTTTPIATDDVGGIQYQKIKLDGGGDGVSVPIIAGQQLAAGSVPVVLTAAQLTTLTTTSITVNQATATNLKTQAEVYQGGSAVAVGNPLEVTLNSATITTLTPPAAITGFATSAKQLEDGHNVTVDNASLTVNIAATQTIGVTDNASSLTVDILASQVIGVTDNASSLTVDLLADQVIGVTDNAASLTIDNADITLCKTALEIMDDWDDTNYCNVNINVAGTDAAANAGAASAQTLRVIAATDSPDVTHLATITTNTASIVTSVQLLDDSVITVGSAIPAKGIMVVGLYDSTKPTAVDDGDAVPILTDAYGRVLLGADPGLLSATLNSANVTTAGQLVAASANNKVYITSLMISVSTAGAYWLIDGDGAWVTSKFYFAANGGIALSYPPNTPLRTPTANKTLSITGNAAGNMGAMITYYLAP